MVKHYDRLLTFKTDGAFITNYGTMGLADGTTTTAFYTSPLNRAIGNVALGQVCLVNNNPLSLFGRSVYEWKLSSYAAKDERNAKIISDRVISSLGNFNLKNAVCYDDEYNTEYWITQGGKAVVYNYTANAWYLYDNIPASSVRSIDGKMYFGTSSGEIMLFSRAYRNDNGTEISARWQSGGNGLWRKLQRKHHLNCGWS